MSLTRFQLVTCRRADQSHVNISAEQALAAHHPPNPPFQPRNNWSKHGNVGKIRWFPRWHWESPFCISIVFGFLNHRKWARKWGKWQFTLWVASTDLDLRFQWMTLLSRTKRCNFMKIIHWWLKHDKIFVKFDQDWGDNNFDSTQKVAFLHKLIGFCPFKVIGRRSFTFEDGPLLWYCEVCIPWAFAI